jgi:hypothetical protein
MEELHNFIPSVIRVVKSKMMRWAGHVACMGGMKNSYKILVGKYEGKRPLRRPRHRWEDNTRMAVRKLGLDGIDWLHVA